MRPAPNSKILGSVPFASVTGKNRQGYTVLSIVTDKTWVLISTHAPLGQDDIRELAKGMKLQQR